MLAGHYKEILRATNLVLNVPRSTFDYWVSPNSTHPELRTTTSLQVRSQRGAAVQVPVLRLRRLHQGLPGAPREVQEAPGGRQHQVQQQQHESAEGGEQQQRQHGRAAPVHAVREQLWREAVPADAHDHEAQLRAQRYLIS